MEASPLKVTAADPSSPLVSEKEVQVFEHANAPQAVQREVERAPVRVSLPSSTVAAASAPVPAAPDLLTVALPDQPTQAAVAAKGLLAISSPTTVDSYENDAYLGSAPVSLELPAGAHTLEYRHGSLRRSVTHMINGNQTAKAMITFDVSVQLNSKPWAEVFLDGTEKKDLGQTPLSGVRVPIGSVLIFENPKYTAKRYRITGNETGIQIVFP